MANPERLDVPLQLVGRPQWLVLGTVAALILAALAWAILTSVPIKVAANGILIDRAGLIEIVARDGGQIEGIAIASGDIVRAGQAVVTLVRTELERELKDVETQRAAAQQRLDWLRDFYAQQAERQANADRQRLATLQETREALGRRLVALHEKEVRVRGLVEQGFTPRDVLIDTEIEIAETQERLLRLADDATGIQVAAVEREGRTSLLMQDEQRTVDEHGRAAERLRSRFAEQQRVTAPSGGTVAEVRVAAGDVIAPGTPIATLAPINQTDTIQALLYVAAGQGKRIQPGMRAEIVPSTVERERYGHIKGSVIAVAPLPTTAAGMRRVLRNDELVEQLRAGGAPIEVRVVLDRNAATRTGFAWSSSLGPAGGTTVGTLVDGRVVIGHMPMLGWLAPGVVASED